MIRLIRIEDYTEQLVSVQTQRQPQYDDASTRQPSERVSSDIRSVS
ncbi:hypothetical protein OROGR_005926 [Orobanche gracilis]